MAVVRSSEGLCGMTTAALASAKSSALPVRPCVVHVAPRINPWLRWPETSVSTDTGAVLEVVRGHEIRRRLHPRACACRPGPRRETSPSDRCGPRRSVLGRRRSARYCYRAAAACRTIAAKRCRRSRAFPATRASAARWSRSHCAGGDRGEKREASRHDGGGIPHRGARRTRPTPTPAPSVLKMRSLRLGSRPGMKNCADSTDRDRPAAMSSAPRPTFPAGAGRIRTE